MRTTRDNQGSGGLKSRSVAKGRAPETGTGISGRGSATALRPAKPGRGGSRATADATPKKPGSKPAGGRYGQAPAKTAAPDRKNVYPGSARPVKPVETVRDTDFLSGRNPVLEALRSGRPISKIYISAGEHQGSIREIIALAKEKEIPVQTTEAAKLEAMSLGVRNQGVVAMVSPVPYSSVDEMVALAESRNEKPCLILLDQLKDPQNLGAVLRTVDAAGAHGVLIPQRRSCQLSAAVAKASAGAIEYVKVAQIGNVAQTLADLKKQGFWVIGTDPGQGLSYYDVDLTGPVVIVIGDEGEGMARLTRERCDSLVQIPMRGKVQSLNASVAGAILLYEMIRQRGNAGSR